MAKRKDCVFSLLEQARTSVVCIINFVFWNQMNRHIISFYYSGFPKETPELKFRLRFFFRSATVCNSLINTYARRFY